MLGNQEHQIHVDVHSYLKIYPNFARLYTYPKPIRAQVKGFELRTEKKQIKSHNSSFNNESFENSIRRTKTRISDIILSNEFDLFTTFTFKSDRQNIDKSKSKMSNWLKSQQKIHGTFQYLIVPEFHKDGKSIHFHALIKGYKGQLVDSGKTINRRKVYNIKSYKSGFSTAVKIDNTQKVSSYVKKYITKDMPKFEGKKRYWCSQNLIRPIIIQNYSVPPQIIFDFHEKYKNESLTISEYQGKLETQYLNGELRKWLIQNNFLTKWISPRLWTQLSLNVTSSKTKMDKQLSITTSYSHWTTETRQGSLATKRSRRQFITTG